MIRRAPASENSDANLGSVILEAGARVEEAAGLAVLESEFFAHPFSICVSVNATQMTAAIVRNQGLTVFFNISFDS